MCNKSVSEVIISEKQKVISVTIFALGSDLIYLFGFFIECRETKTKPITFQLKYSAKFQTLVKPKPTELPDYVLP